MLFRSNTPDSSLVSKRKKAMRVSNEISQKSQSDETLKRERITPEPDEIEAIHCTRPFPMALPHAVCLICIGNDGFTYKERMRPRPRKNVLKKHVEGHFRHHKYQREFECCHPKYSTQLKGIMHFIKHAYDVHKVSH